MQYQWITKECDHSQIEKLHSDLKIHPLLCRLLVQRSIVNFESGKNYFRPDLKELHNPFLMKDMDSAVERIEKAIQNNERILIYGDYDVDGTTAVSLLSSFLKKHYSKIETYIPDRYKEGYGVSVAGIDYAAEHEVSLIIALDCGIKAIDKVEYAKKLGIDFIICDHHRPGDKIPDAVAVLDPKRKDCAYPYKELSGCGVGFKLVQALCEKWSLNDAEWVPLLDLVAVSIGSDIVPITGENRVLAFHGLKIINTSPRPGFAHLIELAGKKGKTMSITDIVFLIGPRINAAGRIAHGQLAVNLLIGSDPDKLVNDSILINEHNNERKELDQSITESALQMIADLKEEHHKSTVLYHNTWHKGVIGIVASRLIEKYYRPTVIFTESNGVLAGSARSVKGFDVYNALEQCSDILEQFGGHMYAAGMTLPTERFDDFKQRFEEVVASTIKDECLTPTLDIDAVIQLSDITPVFFKILKQFAPFGPMNMDPVFRTDNLYDTGRSSIVGTDKSHLKLDVYDKLSGLRISGIGFGMAEKFPLVLTGKPLSIAYHLDENDFNNKISLQMRIKDIKLTEDL